MAAGSPSSCWLYAPPWPSLGVVFWSSVLPTYHTQSEDVMTLSTTEWYNWMTISLHRAKLVGHREQSVLSLLYNDVDIMIPGQNVGDGKSQKLDTVFYFQCFTVDGHCVHDTFLSFKDQHPLCFSNGQVKVVVPGPCTRETAGSAAVCLCSE